MAKLGKVSAAARRIGRAVRPGQVGEAEIGAGLTAARVQGAALGATGGENISQMMQDPGWLKKLLTGKGAKTAGAGLVGYLVLDALMRSIMQGGQMIQQGNLAEEQAQAQAEALSPESIQQEALQPITRAQRDYAMQMLMQQLGGRGTNRARGEAWT